MRRLRAECSVAFDKLKEIMGVESVLDELFCYLDSDTLSDFIDGTISMYDLEDYFREEM